MEAFVKEKSHEVFVVHHTSPFCTLDTKLKIGFIVWLKTLAQECDFDFFAGSCGIELKKGKETIVCCGVSPSDQSSIVDFLTLLIDRKELKNNLKLFCRLTLIGAWPTEPLAGEIEKATWLFDPLNKISLDFLFDMFERFWAEGIAEVLNCDAKAVAGTACYELVHRNSDRSIAFMKNDGEKVLIEPFTPFVASGLFRDFYCLGKKRLDERFEPFFRIRQEDLVTPILRSDDDQV